MKTLKQGSVVGRRASGPTTRPRVLAAQLGSRRDYLLPRALQRLGCLEVFHTDFVAPGGLAGRSLRMLGPTGAALARRRVPGVPAGRVVGHNGTMGLRLMVARARRLPETRRWMELGAAFGRQVVADGFRRANVALTFTSTAEEIFTAARLRGLATVLDHATAPLAAENALVRAAWSRCPAWFEAPAQDADEQEYSERQRREWALSDLILCNSRFLLEMIVAEGGPGERCRVLPLVVPPSPRQVAPRRRARRGLVALFVGDDGLRKGLPDFLEACGLAGIDRRRALVAGSVRLTPEGRRAVGARATLLGRVAKARLLALMARCDVLVLPSVSDTFGMAVVEAMATGCIPIVSQNTGACEVIEEGVTGFVTRVHAPGAIAARLALLADDPARREAMADACRQAAGRDGTRAYARGLGAALQAALVAVEGRAL